jgi:cytochrome P450
VPFPVESGPEPFILDEDIFRNPHQLGALLRAETPVRRVTTPRGLGGWLLTRYEDCRAALNDPRLLKDAERTTRILGESLGASSPYLHPAMRALETHMLNSDPPDHTRLRKLVGKAFTPRTVARLRPRIEAITDDLLDRMAGDEVVDLIEAFALPLPMTVICELLGIDEADRPSFRRWVHTVVAADPGEALVPAAEEAIAFIDLLIDRKRAEPTDDLLSELVAVTDEGDRLSRAELVSMAMLLVTAGHDTTVNLIGNGTLALLRAPGQLAALRKDPGLLPGAVEELLRYDGSVHIATYRFTSEPYEVSGVVIPEGELIMVSLLAANRDAERFEEPGRLDIERKAAGHLAFGHGIHHCLGAPLARLEAQIAIGRLVTRFGGLRLATDPAKLTWRASTLIRGLDTLPVRPDPVPGRG